MSESGRAAMGAVPWLVAGGVGLAFGQGHWPFGLAVVVGAICIVRFFRRAPGPIAFAGFVVAHVLVWEWAYRGMVPMPVAARLGMEAGVSIALGLILLLDRQTARRSRSFLTTLVLPCGWVAFDFLSARLSPGGTWGSIAYSFVDVSGVAQVASLVGWVGITFLVAWIASVTNWTIDRGPATAPARRALASVGAVLVAVFVYGSVRLGTESEGDRAPIACVVAPSTFDEAYVNDVWAYTRGVEAPEDSTQRAIARIEASMNEHFALVERHAAQGARMVVWPEVGGTMTEAEEPAWIARAQALAAAHDVYIGMGLSVFRPRSRQPSVNKLVLVDPSGAVAIDFLKATRPPGVGHVVGDGVLPALDTPLGLVSGAICFDLDFPQLVAQAGRAGADVFLAPSNDWPEARATHARMARMRAIEQGFVLIRPTRDGISEISDPYGRVLASLVLEDRETGALVAAVTTRGAPTLYAATGDAFAWACVVGLLPICLLARRTARIPAGSHHERPRRTPSC